MENLSVFDFTLLFVYFAGLIALGYASSKKQQAEDFLIAKRELGAWNSMATILASKTGSILMSFVAVVYVWGLAAIWVFIGVLLGFLVFLPFALRLRKKSQKRFYTLAHYFSFLYGPKMGALASILSIVIMALLLVINLIAGIKIFIFFTHWPFWICALVLTLIVFVYLFLGGFQAVVKTDVLQYLAIISILFFLAIVLFNSSSELIPSSDWNLFAIEPKMLIGFFIIGIIFPFSMPEMWQRVYSAKNDSALIKGFLGSAAIYVFSGFLLSVVALSIKSKFPEIDPDLALLHGLVNLLPQNLLGLALVLLFAAIMSSVDTYIFTAASSIVQDFSSLDKEQTVRAMRKTIFALAILGVIAAILIQDLVMGTFLVAGFCGILATAVIATWIKKNISQKTLSLGTSFGLAGLILFLLKILINNQEIPPTITLIAILATIFGLVFAGIFLKPKIPISPRQPKKF